MKRFLITLLIGVLLGAAGTYVLLEGMPGAPHPAIGRWTGMLVDLRIDADGTGTITGFALTWGEVDDDTVELRYTKDGDDLAVELDVTGPDEANLNLEPFSVTVKRVAAESSGD